MVLWIFGYGSLIWTPDFHYEERVSGHVKNYRRVFVQGGNGTAGVGIALEPQDDAMTGGVAYRVTADVEHQILSSYLKESQSSSVNAPRALMMDFFTSAVSNTPAISGVMTYITTPQRCNLWYVVLQELAPVETDHIGQRSSAGSDRYPTENLNSGSTNEQRLASRRVSKRYQLQCRDREWFESQRSESRVGS